MTTRTVLKAVAVILPAGLIATAAAAFAISAAADDAPARPVPVVGVVQDAPAAPPTTRPATYPLDVCAVTGQKLGSMGAAPTKLIDGRPVTVCCEGCFATFEKDKETFHAKLDKLIIEKTGSTYPLETCLVSGEKLGGMGEPMVTVHRPTNQVVKFCCGSCEAAFRKSPEKYLAKLDAAASAADQKAD